MARKSQEESEQPAKVYQLDALADQIETLRSSVKQGFDRLDTGVNTLLANPQVSPQTLADTITALEKRQEDRLTEEVAKLELKYGPIMKNNTWLWRTIGGAVIMFIAQAVYLFTIVGKS
jgi:hypothetical protein